MRKKGKRTHFWLWRWLLLILHVISHVISMPCQDRGIVAGLAGVALDLPITTAETNAGLTPPAVAYALLGNGGALLVIIIVFMVHCLQYAMHILSNYMLASAASKQYEYAFLLLAACNSLVNDESNIE